MATIVNADAWRQKVICTGNKLKPEAARAAPSLRMLRLAALALAGSLIAAPALAGEYTSFQHVEMPSPATRDCRGVALLDLPATWRAGDGAAVLQTSGPPHDNTRGQLVAALLIEGVTVLERVAAPCGAVPGRDDGIARDTEPFEETQAFMAEGAVGTLVLPAGAPDRRTPAVVILPDVLGADLRAALYTDQLLGAGFAVLDLATVAGEGGLAAALEALAQHPRVQGQPVGLLGFGAGARIAARWPGSVAARVLLYPGCADLDLVAMQGQAVLLLHGAEDPANAPADCARVIGAVAASGAVARARVYPGAGYAWDNYTNGGGGGVLFPRPNGAGRVMAAPWPALTEYAAAEVAAFFAKTFFGPGR